MLSRSNSNGLSQRVRTVCIASLALCLCVMTSCGDSSDDAFVDPNPLDPEEETSFVMTSQLADSIWKHYLGDDATLTDTEEQVPDDETHPDFDEYYENQSMYLEGTRDILITYSADTAICEFLDTSKKTKNAIKIQTRGAHVTITNNTGVDEVGEQDGRARMNYILRGDCPNGSLRIYSAKKFCVTLDGVRLTNAEGSAINAQKVGEKKRMFVCLSEGTVNQLCDAETYSDTIAGEDEKGCLFAEGKIIFVGKGKLHVTGRNTHAIASDDDIWIHSGVTLCVDSARKDGIHVKDGITQTGGLVKVFARKDAIQADTLTNGLKLLGGRMLTCGKRAITAHPFLWKAPAQLCAIGETSSLPTDTDIPFEMIDEKKMGYTLLVQTTSPQD